MVINNIKDNKVESHYNADLQNQSDRNNIKPEQNTTSIVKNPH